MSTSVHRLARLELAQKCLECLSAYSIPNALLEFNELVNTLLLFVTICPASSFSHEKLKVPGKPPLLQFIDNNHHLTGYEKYNLIRADTLLCFLSRVGPPDERALAAEMDVEPE